MEKTLNEEEMDESTIDPKDRLLLWLHPNNESSWDGLKKAFPELKNKAGRFYGLLVKKLDDDLELFIEGISNKVEEFVKFSEGELGEKLCYNYLENNPICKYCVHLDSDKTGIYCRQYPNMGQTWEGRPTAHATLIHPQSCNLPWYWCIRVCPSFKYKKEETP